MSSPPESGYAFVVLLRDGDDATGLARLLEDVRLPDATTPSVFAAPPSRGVDFFADEAGQAILDQWWADNIPGDAVPVYLLNHEDSLNEWVAGMDGTFYIGLPNPGLADQYGKSAQIKTFMSGGPLDFATIIMRDFSGGGDDPDAQGLIFDQGEALRMAALSSDFPIDLDDTAFDFGEPEPPAAPATASFDPGASPFGNAPVAAPSPFAAPPVASPFGGPAPSPFDAPAPAGPGPSPFGAATAPAFPTAPPGFGAPPGPGGAPANPFDQFGNTFGAPPFATQPAPSGGFGPGTQPFSAPAAPRGKAPEPTTAHPFDLLSGGKQPGGGAGPAPPPFVPSQPGFPDAGQPDSRDEEPLAPWPVGGSTGGAGPFASPPPSPAGGDSGPPPWQSSSGSPPLVPGTRPEAGFSVPRPDNGSGRSGSNRPKVPKISLPGLSVFGGRGNRNNFTETPNRDLANMIVDRGPTIIVMGSRKGGVGKTSYAAGIAIVAGTVLDGVGHKAAIVDANIANPDAWGQMNLREGAATVREVVAALTANREPPPPVHSTTPALAVYPESRETTEYSKTDIKRFADYLRRRFTFIVVDMSNRLPDPMAGPEAAAAAYWLEHSDVLVLPTTSSKQDFNGVLDYLDVRGLPPTVVPYIIPSVKKNREHPVTQQYLSVIRDRVHRIVEIPDEADKVRYAGMEGIPVEQVSPALRIAYRELTEVIVRVPPRARI